ncbi:hypothetical protein T07_12391 [Trichinella nelsoni]|uniref:Uncharacterized protein n=1 Tax=Trichinella nelsoni TaxID=6336 RepID=A0A0V0RW44_9BILA|nr:hypothetical protein T07_12391 [Trichinella nelsoni]
MHHAWIVLHRYIDIACTYITLFTLELHGKKLIVHASGLRALIVHCSLGCGGDLLSLAIFHSCPLPCLTMGTPDFSGSKPRACCPDFLFRL